MKKINLIGWLFKNSHEKQTPQRFARYVAMLIMLLTLGVGQMWGKDPISNISNVWMEGTMNSWTTKPTNWEWTYDDGNHYTATFYIPYSSTNYEFKIRCAGSGWTDGSLYSGDGYWYTSSNTGEEGRWMKKSNAANDQIQCISDPTSHYIKLTCEFWGAYGENSYLKIEQSAVSALSPSLSCSPEGTSLSGGDTRTLNASCTGGSGGYNYSYVVTCGGDDVTASTLSSSSGASVTFTAPVAATEKTYTVTVTASDSHALLSGLATQTATKTFTVAATVTPTIAWAASDPISSYSLVSGESVTLKVTRSNSSSNIIFYKKIGSGSWEEIADQASTTYIYTLPANTGATQTYYFKAALKDGSPYPETSASDAVTVYGKKTIHVRNTNDWDAMNLYVYYKTGDTPMPRSEWPGNGTGVTATIGQWYDVVITTQYPYFILNNGTDQISGNDTYYYSKSSSPAITDNAYYIIEKKTGNNLSLSASTEPTKPGKPSVSAPTTFTNTTVTIKGSISATNGNDALSDYGFYWSDNADDDTADEIKAHGTNVPKGSSDFSGAISSNLTSLTAGTTINYITYATNGKGTTLSDVQSFVVPYSLNISSGTGCASISPAAGTHYMKVGDNVSATAATGYTFSNWSLSSVTMSSPSTTTGVTTSSITAAANGGTIAPVYRPNTYTIVFNKNNESATGNMSDKAMTYNVAANLTSNAFELSGYSFIGWDTKSDGSGDRYLDGAEVNNLTSTDAGTVNLYAQWAPAHTVTIAAKVGETTIPNAEYVPVNFIANTTLPVSQSAPTIAGYDFSSWTLDANLSSADATVNPIAVTASADATLTANYTYHSYTVTYPDEATAHCVYGDGKSTSLDYKSQGTFTVTPAAGYTIDVSANVSLSQNGNTYTFAQGTTAVEITITPTELDNTITVINGTPASVTTKVATGDPATVTAAAAPEGKKFDHWAIDDAITLTSGTINDRTISFHASRDTRISAVYVDRVTKTVHFAKPYGWNTVTAVFSNSGSSPSSKMTAEGTFTYEGATYYTFSYYVDNTGEDGGDQTAQAAWNQVVFSDDGDGVKTKTITSITNGYYYAKGSGESAGRATPFAEWYLRGNLNGSENWTSGVGIDLYKYPFEVDGEGTSATYAYGARTGDKQYFRIYRVSTDQWFRTSSSNSDADITLESSATLQENSNAADVISTGTSETKGVYLFELTNINSATPSLKVTHPEDTKSNVTITAGAHGTITEATSNIEQLGRYMPTAISATANAGYRFKEWVTTGGAVVDDPTSPSTTATATADGTITATFTNEGIVYLDLSAISGVSGWNENHPYVYFYSGSYWSDTWGSGSMSILSGGHAMTRIGATNIWYYDYTSDPGVTRTTNVIAFTDKQKNGQNNFYQCNAIYRSDFYPELNMFVPQNYRTNELNNSAYYNRGYWMKYNEAEAGYRLRIYDGQANKLQQVIPFVDTDYHDGDRNEYTATLHVDGSATARFELIAYDQGTVNGHEYSGTYYGNNGTINSSLTDNGWNYEAGGGKQTTINLNSSGDYIFTLNCNTDGQLWVKVTYPLAVGDFRVNYCGLRTTTDGSKSDVYSDEIPRLTVDGTRTDKVSFFVVQADGAKAPSLSLETVSSINAEDGTVTWTTPESGVTFSAKAGTDIASLASGVYVFEIKQTKSGDTYTLTYEDKGAYEGSYYIRTDYADGGWVSYKQDANKLNRTTNENAGYTDYFCRFVDGGKNVKFCIANDYNSTLTEVKTSDDLNANGDGNITVGANTRFEYDRKTNAVDRSYIGASDVNTFLYIVDADPSKIFQTNGSALTAETQKFADQENWIYMLDVLVTPGAEYQLKAEINGNTQYFDGTESEKTLLGGSGGNQYMRLIYDFKNNHLIKAWKPGAAVSGSIAINADVMLIREDQGNATQLSFANASSELTSVQKVYGVLGFTKSVLTNGSKSSQERSLYWISFPFDVKLKDIFGFGKFGEDYIIRRYNGEKRARIGWFAETSTFWETMDPDSEVEEENTMKAYEGYMVALDKGLFSADDSRWKADGKAISEIYLYFPSETNVGTLKQKTTTITLPEMIYPYDRYFDKGEAKGLNHKVTDSNWRVIGVGSLENSGLTATALDGVTAKAFDFYEWTASTNSLGIVANAQVGGSGARTFNAGHAVMVQWAGKITWENASVPSSVAARNKQEKKNYDIELDLNYNDEKADRTYVILKEDASPDFVLNEDVYKVTNSNLPNIYAYAGSYDCGISRVPVESQTVPVGVITRKNGTYTFSMPTNFDGTVTLIDKFAQTRTNLALEDYEVALPKGTINDRFELELDIRKVPTAIDGVTDGNGSLKDGKAHKFIENGIMYILRDGILFDARGNKVK